MASARGIGGAQMVGCTAGLTETKTTRDRLDPVSRLSALQQGNRATRPRPPRDLSLPLGSVLSPTGWCFPFSPGVEGREVL